MDATKSVLMMIYVLVGLYIIYFLIFKKNPYQREYEQMYNEILTSDKYKVKGQFDKRD